MWRRLLLIFTLGAFAGIFVIPINPVHSKLLKLAHLCSFGATWVGLLLLMWRYQKVRIAILILPLFFALPLLLPGRPIKTNELRANYVQRMNAFQETSYYWGGENSRGIDCSGLPRRALRDALLSYGFRNFNGRAFRGFLEQWWYDASALALSEGYRDYTTPVGVSGTIEEIDSKSLKAGDLAVTDNGVHALAYIGEGRWIQAEPGIQKVVNLHAQNDENPWFRVPVSIYRWRVLTD